MSTIIGFREPIHAKRTALGVGLGLPLPLVLVVYFIFTPESANLWPLSLIVGTVVGMPPAFAGAYFGKFLRTSSKESWREGAAVKVFGLSVLVTIAGYLIGLFGGMFLVGAFSSNVHDKSMEAAMTGALSSAR